MVLKYRELEVLHLIACGMSTQGIEWRTNLSNRTVIHYTYSLFNALGLRGTPREKREQAKRIYFEALG